jgi:hypothetical protein
MAGLTPLAVGRTVQLLFLASDYITVALGLVISYVALRGYLDHGSRPMLFVSVGFALVLGVPGLVSAVFLLGGVGTEVVVGAIGQASEILGMVCILYGLAMKP